MEEIARVYAEALFDVAKEKDESDAISALARIIENAKEEEESGGDNDEFATESDDDVDEDE